MNLGWLYTDEDEKPLDRPCTDGGYTGILQTVGCIGDSLASGEFEVFDDNGARVCMDIFEYSWGQFFARISGNKVYNFSKGGMTAREYCRSFAAKNGFWDPALACRSYVIALGCNDAGQCRRGELAFGELSDIDKDETPDTFVGWFTQIIKRYRQISPKCRMFLMTFPKDSDYDSEFVKKHYELMYALAEKFEFTYVIDLYKYAPEYDDEFKEHFYMNGHMNPLGYEFTARLLTAYLDYIIRHNPHDFDQYGVLGGRPHDATYKW